MTAGSPGESILCSRSHSAEYGGEVVLSSVSFAVCQLIKNLRGSISSSSWPV